jgi:AcrR family transcriptional regulator
VQVQQSRSEAKEQTRRRLIEAAAEVIAERGFHGASLMEIADRADVTTGAIYSNFRSKEGLFLAVLDSIAIGFDHVPSGSEGEPVAERLKSLARWLAAQAVALENRRLLQLQVEFAQLALRDPTVMRILTGRVREERGKLGALLASREAAPPPRRTPPPQQLGELILGMLQGLMQQRLVDPEHVPEDLFVWAVEAILFAAGPSE